ncbi:hypothetical protein [Pseudoflavitalea sp. G-6-1-2]|uniref:hypothetical protein n=1 Tax=Pseudoflavitalea sp. G-6-1-2 TaxID=2728841 RepID=UPI001981CA85|nr:hypothetical protein [Pseudoflavitalea sp. G-6-1-2]
MKSLIILSVSVLVMIVAGSSCSTTHSHRRVVVVDSKPLPPGQAKKIAGAQSAKEFAPGQQKKKKHKNKY